MTLTSLLMLAAIAGTTTNPADPAGAPPTRIERLDESVPIPGVAPAPLRLTWEPGEVVVKFAENALFMDLPPEWDFMSSTGIPEFDAMAADFEVSRVRRFFGHYTPKRKGILDASRMAILRFPEGADVERISLELRRLPEVEYAHPNFIEKPHATIPDDTLYTSQWHHGVIHTPEAWDIESDCANVVFAISDDGLDLFHEDFQGNLWINPYEDIATPGMLTVEDCNGQDDGPDIDGDGFPGNGIIDDLVGEYKSWCNYVAPTSNHGSHVGGIAGARGNNALGVTGVCWTPKIMDTGSFVYMSDHGADVINRSFQHSMCFQGLPTANNDAVRYAWANGTIVIWSAGNDDFYMSELPPACEAPSLEVAATTSSDNRSSFSNYGRGVQIAAPGSGILSLIPTGWPVWPPGATQSVPCAAGETDPNLDCYASMSGTSMAAPVVVGVMGLTIEAHRNDPTWYDPSCPMGSLQQCTWAPPGQCPPCKVSAQKVVDHVKGTADSIDGIALDTWGFLGHGRVDAFAAVSNSGPVPQVRVVSATVNDPLGDGDGDAEFGEEVEVIVTVAQKYGASGGAIQGTLSVHPSYTSFATVTQATGSFGTIAAGAEGDNAAAPFRILVDTPNRSQRIYFHVDYDDGAGYTERDGFGLLLNEGREPGFPADLGQPGSLGQPTFVELDGDGQQESVLTADGQIFAFHGDGTTVDGFPIVPVGFQSFGTSSGYPVAVEDVDLDGRFEYFVSCGNSICAVRADGTELADGDGDIDTWGPFIQGGSGVPVISNLNGDEFLEVVATSFNSLRAVDHGGQELAGFPVSAPAGYAYHNELAVGDIDNDGIPEIVTAVVDDIYDPMDQLLEVRNADGTLRWSQAVNFAYDPAHPAAPLIADVDRDGVAEIVSATGDSFYVFNADGSQIPGSPITIPTEIVTTSGAACQPTAGWTHTIEIESMLAAADLDGDGWEEFIIRDEQILQEPVTWVAKQRIACLRRMRVVRWDPNAGQLVADAPVSLSHTEKLRSPLLAADFGAGPQVVYANHEAFILRDNALGSPVTRFFDTRRWPGPINKGYPGILSLALGDADGDGIVEAQIPLTNPALHGWGIESGPGPQALMWGTPYRDRWATRSLNTNVPDAYACDLITTQGTFSHDEGWGPVCNPIQLTGPVVVPAGLTLSIRPGTIVEATDPSAVITVQGTLEIDAPWDNPVTFRDAAGASWQGIVIQGSGTTSLTGLDVQDAVEGLRIENVSPTVSWSRFGGNDVGLLTTGSAAGPTLEHVLFSGNGSALQPQGGSQPSIDHAVFYGNTIGFDNASNTAQVSINNSILWNNGDDISDAPPTAAVTATYSVIEDTGGPNEGTGVLHADPRFVDAAQQDFHLLDDSPAIDAGDPMSDYLMEPDANGCRINVGLYGNTVEATSLAGAVNHCTCLNLTLSGTLLSNETWTAACNPIRLQGPLTVPAGVTLTVQPGTLVQGGTNDSEIIVDGLLHAEGQSGLHVTFEGYAGASWEGIDLNGPGAHTLLFSEVSLATRVRVASTAARVERSRFLDNVTGLVIDNATPVLRNNVFGRNNTGIDLLGPTAPQIDLCTFHTGAVGIQDSGLAIGQTVQVNNSIFEALPVECSVGQGDIVVDYGMVRLDGGCTVTHQVAGTPQFVDELSDDYHLQDTSPGINAGDPATDYFAEPDPNGCRVDLGAYGDTEEATSQAGIVDHCRCHGLTLSGSIPLGVDETWPLACSPVRLQSNFTVEGTLTIDPGVIVEVPDYEIDVTGTLTAVGTQADPITFQQYGVGLWDGLQLGAPGAHLLEHVRIRDAERVEVLGDAATLRRSEIVSGTTGVIIHGAPAVSSLLLANNNVGIDVRAGSQVTLSNLTMTRNATGLTSVATTPVSVKNSIFWNNLVEDMPSSASVDLTYSITEGTGGALEGTGVLHGDPQFVAEDAGGDWTLEDYHLQDTSPGMDSGDPNDDYIEEAFENGCRIDMGTYGNTPESTSSTSGQHCNCPGVDSSLSGVLTVDTTLAAACGPYYIHGLLEIPFGLSLTIEPGTTVLMRNGPGGGGYLRTYGSLTAIGTPTERIVFDSGDGSSGGQVQCYNANAWNPKCHLAYFDLQNMSSFLAFNSNGLLEHGRFRNNTTGVNTQYGGSIVIRNSLFENNNTGVYAGHSPSPIIEGCTFVNNNYGVQNQNLGAPKTFTVSNSIFWNNNNKDLNGWQNNDPRIILRYSLTERVGEVIEDVGVLHDDPLFVDLAGGDYHLQPISPAIDAANPFAPAGLEPSPNGCRANMGAYGNTPEAASKTSSSQCDCDPYTSVGPLTQDETWSAFCGPYRLTGQVSIPTGGTLTVQEGAEIMGMNDTAAILNDGNLNVSGSSLAPARIWGVGSQRWGGIECQAGASQCTLDHFRFHDADGLTLRSPSPTIGHGWFQMNDRGIWVAGNSQPLISNSAFVGNEHGIEVIENGQPTTVNASFTNNIRGFVYSTQEADPPVLQVTNSAFASNNFSDVTGWIPGSISNPGDPRVELTYSLISRWWESIESTGTINGDPEFAGYLDPHLETTSPCIDAGDPASPFDDEPRPNGCRINMGAFGNTSEAQISASAPDQDGDGQNDACDCAPADAGVWSSPPEVTGLGFDPDKITLTWDSSATHAGSATVHEVVRGVIGDLPVGLSLLETCLTPGGIAANSLVDAIDPPANSVYWYLVRGTNPCADGSYGWDSQGTPRQTDVCPGWQEPCPSVLPCMEGSCLKSGLPLSSADSGLNACNTGQGILDCGIQSVHVVTYGCFHAPCCFEQPACLCPAECNDGTYLECR